MKRILLSFLALGLLASCNQNSVTALKSEKLALNEASNKVEAESPSFYDFTVTDLNGEQFSFSQLKGKRVLIVNTASKCGFTPQYEDLQALNEKHGGEKFTIIGFPCNQFGNRVTLCYSDSLVFGHQVGLCYWDSLVISLNIR